MSIIYFKICIEMNSHFAYYPIMESIYFDWAATAAIRPEIPEIITKSLFEIQGNPSSIHSPGKIARKNIDSSRKLCADLMETKPDQLIFTSGGTESNNIVLSSLFLKKPGSHIIISAIEHPSIYEYITNFKKVAIEIDIIKPASNGIIEPEKIKYLLRPTTIFVSIMAVNNETGAIQPIKEITSIIREYEKKNGRSIHIHTDAVQALGKITFSPTLLNIDSASFSSHKIGGPKGVGMLFLKKPIEVLSPGGGQEFSIRPGTENVSGIMAFTKALQISFDNFENNFKNILILKTMLINHLLEIKGLKLFFETGNNLEKLYSPYILSATVAPLPGEVLVRILSDEGIQISTGSACSSRNRKKQLRVLASSGISEKEAAGSIRISLGWSSTENEIRTFCTILEKKLSELRKFHT